MITVNGIIMRHCLSRFYIKIWIIVLQFTPKLKLLKWSVYSVKMGHVLLCTQFTEPNIAISIRHLWSGINELSARRQPRLKIIDKPMR